MHLLLCCVCPYHRFKGPPVPMLDGPLSLACPCCRTFSRFTAGTLALFLDIEMLAQLVSIGTLMVFVLVCGGVIFRCVLGVRRVRGSVAVCGPLNSPAQCIVQGDCC